MGEFYVIQPNHDAEGAFGSPFAGVKYNMVQPALVVVDRSGQVVQKWSWRTISPKPEPMEEMTVVADSNGGQTKLVQLRPLTSDILASIREGREVKTQEAIPFG